MRSGIRDAQSHIGALNKMFLKRMNRISRYLVDNQHSISLANIGMLLLWIWLYRGMYPYLRIIFTRQEFRTNQILIAGILILVVKKVYKQEYIPRLNVLPQLYVPALIMMLGGSTLYLIVERYLDINTFSASLFGLATYGLLGLWIQPSIWRGGLPAALLIIGALPFGEHLETFVGYPLRVLTAEIVRAGLLRFGVHEIGGQTLGVNTILVFESGITKVDLPCSGVKSLWTGGLFLLAATWIERRKINLRWLLVASGFVTILLIANLGRVATLVVVGQVAGWRLIAEMLHVPLGMLGFGGACIVALVALRWTCLQNEFDRNEDAAHGGLKHPVWLYSLLTVGVLFMAILYTPRSEPQRSNTATELEFPTGLNAIPWPMREEELAWLAKAGIKSADRWRFQWQEPSKPGTSFTVYSSSKPNSYEVEDPYLSGSILLVSSRTWREHHRPEACLEVYGLTVDRSFSTLATPEFPVRVLMLTDDRGKDYMTAVYWLQSPTQVTDDYGTRIWADLTQERQRWVLITILFDSAIDPASEDVLSLYQVLRFTIHQYLGEG